MRNLGPLDAVFLILLVIGGLNWGLVGLFGVDLVAAIFGPMSVISRLIYILVGVSALHVLITRLPRNTPAAPRV